MKKSTDYWFPAKRYGWGWGMPVTWQGKVVFAAFFVLLAIGALTLLPRYGQLSFVIFTVILSVILIVICWLKGEPPKWRWGNK